LVAWTDFSVNAGAANTVAGGTPVAFPSELVAKDNVTFATTANIIANRVIVSELITNGHTSASITVPRNLLVNNGQSAKYIYLLLAMNCNDTGINEQHGTDAYTRSCSGSPTGTGSNRFTHPRPGMGVMGEERELGFFNPITLSVLILGDGPSPAPPTFSHKAGFF
jgi:hypothetical protein